MHLPGVLILRLREHSLHEVNEHFEHRTTKQSACVGGFAKPSATDM